MGKGTDAFKRELGKNTAKWVSNKVFGDGHSTPHRVSVKVQQQKLENDIRKAELKAETKKRRAENRKEFFSKGKEFLSDNIGKSDEVLKTESKIDEIVSLKIPTEVSEIKKTSNYLLSLVKNSGWKAGENEKHINALSDACLIKLEQCVIALNSNGESNYSIYIQEEIKQLKKKKFIQKYMIFIGAGLFMVVLIILIKLGVLK